MTPVYIALILTMGSSNAPNPATHPEPQYVGVARCKSCHTRIDRTGPYDIWRSSRHAQAYRTLGTDRARELAALAEVEEHPQRAPECLECHVTGYGRDSSYFLASFREADGIQCEACHGPGSLYWTPDVMSLRMYIDDPEAQRQIAFAAGLIIPDEQTCITCHNERSPGFKGFDFKTYYEKIRHDREG
jgi:hypothetical protein